MPENPPEVPEVADRAAATVSREGESTDIPRYPYVKRRVSTLFFIHSEAEKCALIDDFLAGTVSTRRYRVAVHVCYNVYSMFLSNNLMTSLLSQRFNGLFVFWRDVGH